MLRCILYSLHLNLLFSRSLYLYHLNHCKLWFNIKLIRFFKFYRGRHFDYLMLTKSNWLWIYDYIYKWSWSMSVIDGHWYNRWPPKQLYFWIPVALIFYCFFVFTKFMPNQVKQVYKLNLYQLHELYLYMYMYLF